MEYQAAYGLGVESLDIVIIDDSRSFLAMIRSMISTLKVARVRSYDRADLALHAIMQEPPNVILTDITMAPMSGTQLLRLIRRKTMDPLCFIPVIVITAHATEQRVAQLFKMGAHHVMPKPFSSNSLQQRLRSLCTDSRMMTLEGDHYVIDGVRQTIEEKRTRLRSLAKARQFHEEIVPTAHNLQKDADKIMTGLADYKVTKGRVVSATSHGMRLGDTLRKDANSSEEAKPKNQSSRSRRYAGVGSQRR